MDEIVTQIAAIIPPEYALVVLALCFCCSLFVAVAPPTLTEKMPDFIMVIINALASNFKNAANKYTDLKGNKDTNDKAQRKT